MSTFETVACIWMGLSIVLLATIAISLGKIEERLTALLFKVPSL